jgi:RNA polymerase sigma-70 factor (ECF subfamily)
MNSREREFQREALPHIQALYVTAYRLTGGREAAEDLTQDTLVRAFVNFDRYEKGTNCRAWLMRMMTRLFINGERHRQVEQRFARYADSNLGLNSWMGQSSLRGQFRAEPSLTRTVANEELQRALDTLSDEARAVVVLTDAHGYSYREVAEMLEVPIGTVMSRLHRARQALRALLTDSGSVATAALETESSAGNPESNQPVSLDQYRKSKELS